ncbi:cytochrome P450 [Streptomyces aurantiacus]|uniref:Putative Fatty-acid peroxygenase n=1 Tax=Streptomyces aurantiacus JA 4570 TaxID=1286094 RepID=S3ZDH3_9ACTN|nr:cytochrome P450 [Streptomyces aurantiacus]EPH41158.1 putative Fatty-acid peroxygenase [Streptomyces aurantiacus JA 4570]
MVDNTLPFLTQGYAWLPDLSRRKGPGPVRTRLLGKPAIALRGPAAVAFFYDENHVRRRTALPEPVLSTLFGKGAVHTLDGPEHRRRKALFVSLLKDASGVAMLARLVAEEWERSSKEWTGRPQVTLFDEVSVLITRAVCAWAGVPLGDRPDDEARRTARDLVAMVDGFATAGPRHWQARRARRRQEKRLARLVEEIRSAGGDAPADSDRPASAVQAVAAHRDADGELLDPHTAAVEILNVIRPTAAITWYAVFGAHALHRNPGLRERLATDSEGYARAFAHELRRFYPFAPFVAGLAPDDVQWRGEAIPEGTLVLLDLYGQNHDPELWHDPYMFDPDRFLGREPGRDELVPQGGGEAAEGHRCPGEDITLAVLSTLLPRLARLQYQVPEQDLRIPLSRMPTGPRSGFVISEVH